MSPIALRIQLQRLRDMYIKKHPDAFITLDHIKSNYDNWMVLNSVQGQTKDLQAVSTEDFCNLSEIMKGIRLPRAVDVHRAMEANDFNIGRMLPEEFLTEYYREGKSIVVPIYMSTSLDKNIAYRFAKDKPERFIINLKVDKDVPAVYMEGFCPGDGKAFGYEDEINIIRNAKIILGKLSKTINPLNNKKIYEIDGHVTGFVDVPSVPMPKYQPDDEELALIEEMKKMMHLGN